MKKYALLICGFAFFGLMIGYVVGITSSEISQTILTALFAFMGGKLFIDIKENDAALNFAAGAILTFFSLFFLVGLNTGIYVKVNHSLTSARTKANAPGGKADSANVYLRNLVIPDDLEMKYRRGEITADSVVQLIFKANAK